MHSRGSILLAVLLVISILVGACAAPAAPAPAQPAAAPTTAPAAAAPTTAPAAAEPTKAAAAAAEPKTVSSAPAEPVKTGSLAVILTGPWQDHSWNQAAYEAAQTLGKNGVKIAFSESVADTDAARVLRQYADQGFEMIVAHSFGYGDAAFQVAKDYPKINFAWAGGIKKVSKNVADYDQPFYEAAYPIGVLAGKMSKSGTLGAMYGFDIPVCHSMGEAFLAGAKTVNPNAKLISTAVGDWIDVAKAREAALAQADAGVDFWIECGEGPSLGTVQAAKARGGWVTGYAGDMSSDGPENVLVSLAWNLVPLFSQMLDDTHKGTFDSVWYAMGIKQDVLQLKYNDALKSKIPADALAAVDQSIADIKSGKVTVPYVPEAKK